MRYATDLLVQGHFFFAAGFEPGNGQFLCRHDTALVRSGQFLHQQLVLGMHQSIGQSVGIRGIDAYFFRIARFDHFYQRLPLIGIHIEVPLGFQQAHVVAGNGRFFQFLPRTAIKKDHYRAAARREPLGGQHGFHHGVFVVLPRYEHPHIYTLAPHELRQKVVEPVFQYLVDDTGANLFVEDAGHGRLSGELH